MMETMRSIGLSAIALLAGAVLTNGCANDKLGTGGPAPEGFELIPAGPFEMGDPFGEGYEQERPVHTVQVSAFYMGKYEVTKALWDEVREWGATHATHGYTDL